MKTDVANLWNEYKNSLNDVLRKKLPRIERAIEEFESQGHELVNMSRQESKIISNILGDGISYSSSKNYCVMLNNFLRLYEERYNVCCEKCYAQKDKAIDELYYSEDELINDIEDHLDDIVKEIISKRNIDDSSIEQLKDSYLSQICILILRWYGITFEELCNLKKSDIVNNKIILPDREKSISDRALNYIEKYKNKKEITHFWVHPVTHSLPNTPYLFRREGVKKSDDINEPMTLNLLAVAQHRFMKDSKIKKQIGLSGAFNTISERTSNPTNLLERVHDYLGNERISDINIKNGWVNYLDGLAQK